MTVIEQTAPAPPALPAVTSRDAFVLSFDFEDWHQVAYHLRGRSGWWAGSPAFDRHLGTVLNVLDELGLRATFFVVGATAERHPSALEDVVARGHELGCHGYEHVRLTEHTPGQFREDVKRCLDVVGDICGVRPLGFRAPWFSITDETQWAHEILEDLGFAYDSSLYDSPLLRRRPRGIPQHPFHIGGIWEFPVAVWKRSRALVPLGGGSYWRALPGMVLWPGLESVAQEARFPVLYFHPYEFASEVLQVGVPERATWRERRRETYRRIYRNTRRRLVPIRFREAARRFTFVTFGDVLDDLR